MERSIRTFSWGSQPGTGYPPDLPQHPGLVLPAGEKGAFTPEECQRIVDLGRQLPEAVATTGDGDGRITYTNRKATVRTVYPAPESDWIFDRLETIVAKAVHHFRFDLAGFYEGGQIYHYPRGGFLNWHMDIGHRHMSNRKLAISLQLSSGEQYEGGDLRFEDCEQPAPREQGTVIVFPAYMRHGVTPITRGHRDCFVTWVHGPPFR